MTGRLEMIVGPMYSGKTEELMRRLHREQIAGRKVVLWKVSLDQRYSTESEVVSHNGRKMEALTFDPNECPLETLGIFHWDVVGIDEVQFFQHGTMKEDSMLTDIRVLVEVLHIKVVCSGLDMDFRRKPFGVVPRLMSIADQVDKLDAICHKCGGLAIYTQRLLDGIPTQKGPQVQVGALESYEARCRECYAC